MPTDVSKQLFNLISLASKKRFLKKAVFSKCADKETVRATATLFERGGDIMIQIETLRKDGKALHQNFSADDISICETIAQFSQINLIGDGADAEYRKSKSGSETIIGEKKFLSAVENYGKKIEIKAHNRAKAYAFDGSEPFMFELGISDKNGRVYDKKQAKFRQINRFTEHIAEVYKYLPSDGELNVLDLCCGKSYLSFAVYHYLTVTMNRKVNMVGIDLKKDVIEFCSNTAENLGYSGLRFYACNIDDYEYKMPVHLVVSLHACDIATDIVLTKAIELKAKVILSTPCCQKELLQNIDTDAFEFVTKYPMLKKKLCDALTDAMRLERLSAHGYDVTALELTDPDDTPKNILLRAIKKGDGTENAKAEYQKLCESLVGDKKLYIKG
ncbi:MAG: SAM-dependent methyltransferase [Clostridia bacterium]|nr:SAM-dependent methyltransferase [Clostridia bacterium]